MLDYDYFFIIQDNVYNANKVDIKLCRCINVKFLGILLKRKDVHVLFTQYEVKRDKDSIQLVIDDLKSKKFIYDKELNDKMATEQFIESVNGMSIKK